ncbi:MAG TPA: protein kinase [Longimicrobiales bacterium]
MIRVLTLPGVRVLAASREIATLQGRRLPLALLSYLAVERSASRDSVLGVFWPEREEERARHSLSQTLYELRRELGEEWLAATGDVLAVASDVTTDAIEFEAAVQGGRWAYALDLYGGAFLSGVPLVPARGFEEWVDRRRAQLGRLHRKARRELLADRLRAGDSSGALAVAVRWAELEPMDDEAQQRAIELLARCGHRAEALRAYDAFLAQLRADDLEPMPELAQLVATIRSGSAEAVPAGATAGDLRAAAPASGASQHAAPVPPPGEAGPLPGLAPDLRVVRLLAEGRNAQVYLAREPALGRLVVVKVLAPASLKDAVLVRRFEREARAVARIQHPNVAPLFRLGILADGTWYLVLPYIDGGSLEDRLAARGPLPVDEVRRVLAQLASGLAAAHRVGIVHRDVRPGNVLYDRESNRVLLVDFGTAGLLESGDDGAVRLTRAGEPLGIPAYASPEQLRGDVVTDRSDVYSLGVLAFELLAGRRPFQASTIAEITAAHLAAEPPSVADLRPDVDAGLAQLIQRCLNKRPEQRPYAREIVDQLEI